MDNFFPNSVNSDCHTQDYLVQVCALVKTFKNLRRSRNTGHYLLLNLSLRDILVAGLCIPFTLDSEIIHLTWNLGLPFCISYRLQQRQQQ